MVRAGLEAACADTRGGLPRGGGLRLRVRRVCAVTREIRVMTWRGCVECVVCRGIGARDFWAAPEPQTER